MCFANTLVLRPYDFEIAARSKRRAATPSCGHADFDVCGAAAVAVGRAT